LRSAFPSSKVRPSSVAAPPHIARSADDASGRIPGVSLPPAEERRIKHGLMVQLGRLREAEQGLVHAQDQQVRDMMAAYYFAMRTFINVLLENSRQIETARYLLFHFYFYFYFYSLILLISLISFYFQVISKLIFGRLQGVGQDADAGGSPHHGRGPSRALVEQAPTHSHRGSPPF
jgi:hypothetical protein